MMLLIKFLVVCISLLFVCQRIAAQEHPDVKNHPGHEHLQTYIIPPSDDSDGTTAYPPLIENEPIEHEHIGVSLCT